MARSSQINPNDPEHRMPGIQKVPQRRFNEAKSSGAHPRDQPSKLSARLRGKLTQQPIERRGSRVLRQVLVDD